VRSRLSPKFRPQPVVPGKRDERFNPFPITRTVATRSPMKNDPLVGADRRRQYRHSQCHKLDCLESAFSTLESLIPERHQSDVELL
jgi:hypothetical protein